jgi:hypothetical protein
MDYTYKGDRLTDETLKGQKCNAIRKPDGKCIRSKMATMLVQFENGKKHVVLARQLRKIIH